MKWDLTGKWIISNRLGKATFKVQVRKTSNYGIGEWDYKWRWAKIEDIQELNLMYNGS